MIWSKTEWNSLYNTVEKGNSFITSFFCFRQLCFLCVCVCARVWMCVFVPSSNIKEQEGVDLNYLKCFFHILILTRIHMSKVKHCRIYFYPFYRLLAHDYGWGPVCDNSSKLQPTTWRRISTKNRFRRLLTTYRRENKMLRMDCSKQRILFTLNK